MECTSTRLFSSTSTFNFIKLLYFMGNVRPFNFLLSHRFQPLDTVFSPIQYSNQEAFVHWIKEYQLLSSQHVRENIEHT